MSFNISAFGHVVGDDAEAVEKSICDEVEAVIEKYRDHFTGGSFSGTHVSREYEGTAAAEVASAAAGTGIPTSPAVGAPAAPDAAATAAESVSTNPPESDAAPQTADQVNQQPTEPESPGGAAGSDAQPDGTGGDAAAADAVAGGIGAAPANTGSEANWDAPGSTQPGTPA